MGIELAHAVCRNWVIGQLQDYGTKFFLPECNCELVCRCNATILEIAAVDNAVNNMAIDVSNKDWR